MTVVHLWPYIWPSARADLKAQTAESTSTEMIDVAKIKSSAIASRDARVYRVARRAAGAGGISVGRARDSDVWIDDTRVSKRHAAFETGADGLVLHDLSSTNGTFVNERKLDKDERTAVKPNDVVRFGRATKMHFLDPVGFFDYLLLLRRFGI